MRILKFDDPLGPNVAANLLPTHSDKWVSAIIENGGKRTKMDVEEVKTQLKWVWKKMVESGLITQDLGEKSRKARNYCEFHDEEGNEIQRCSKFRALVQGLMDNKELEFFEYTEGLEGEDVYASKEKLTKNIYRANHPVKPVSFPYKDSKRVLWNYDYNVTIPGEENSVNTSKEG
ncbi:hypothetical protein EPI10_021855 [Gossypium australe]|uniref:Uncharacterized protein n=1 Tax=Gossypium australe TaxID=47621 RepID=A0A5B6WJA0_9ROSI|nr:hypothetical protein EPI10_021855 [Gossypium australe]